MAGWRGLHRWCSPCLQVWINGSCGLWSQGLESQSWDLKLVSFLHAASGCSGSFTPRIVPLNGLHAWKFWRAKCGVKSAFLFWPDSVFTWKKIQIICLYLHHLLTLRDIELWIKKIMKMHQNYRMVAPCGFIFKK